MENKRSAGLKIFTGMISIISGYFVYRFLADWEIYVLYTDFIGRCFMSIFFLGSLTSVIGGTGIFFLKKWGRMLALLGASFLFLVLLYAIFGLIIGYRDNLKGAKMYILYSILMTGAIYVSPFVLYFLTRPRVKEQFK